MPAIRPTLLLSVLTLALACVFAFALSPCCLGALPANELTPAQRAQLDRDKLIIGAKDFPQIFEPYLFLGKTPDSIRFITSDAALAAYHALFEDSFRELELRRAARLRGDLEKLYAACYNKNEKNAEAPELIQLILGPALVILGTPATADNFAPALLSEIKRQASLITAAEISECPPWLDYHDATDSAFKIDYRRCKPVSFYDGNPTLENYYRVVRWLQMAPLRASNDKELSAWSRMAEKACPWDNSVPDFQRGFTGLRNYVGPLDEFGIIICNPQILGVLHMPNYDDEGNWDEAKALSSLRTALLKTAPQDAKLDDIIFHVMPTHALPDAEILLQFLKNGMRPNGLTVAAYLGSDFARERMPKVDLSKWNEWVERARLLEYPQDGAPRSLYVDYLDVLRTLNMPPVKNAPPFMSSPPWQAKTCQTQLAGWSQMRHTFALQAKVAIYFTGVGPDGCPPGFIEPNPAFWREYARFVERTIALLQDDGVFESSIAQMADEIRRQANKIESLGLHLPNATLEKVKEIQNEDPVFDSGMFHMLALTGYDALPFIRPDEYKSAQEMQASYQHMIAWLRASADKVERGELIIPNKYNRTPPLKPRWDELATLARRLETILAKQFAETELTEADRDIIISFGNTLAECMGYFGDSKGMPRDDAPRWAEVAHDPNPPEQSLGVATGRARALFVLYPWHGREVLCTGAVLSYYEEWAPTNRLTDTEWKQKLDSPNGPAQPDWLAPILAK